MDFEDVPWEEENTDDAESPFVTPKHRDSKIDEAKRFLLDHVFTRESTQIVYGQQVEVLLEDRYFHWITSRAVSELAKEGKIQSEREPLFQNNTIVFYTAKQNRFWTRRRLELRNLVLEYCAPEFTEDLGRHGETMFDVALPREGFLPVAFDTRKYNGKVWTDSNHNLDRVFQRDGIAYGVEIKNTLPYIPRKELIIKLAICDHLGIKPLFIVRAAAKSYIHEVWNRGGYTMLFKYQLYPWGYRDLARRVSVELSLPVDSPRSIQAGTVKRFLKWHYHNLNRP